MEDHSYLDDILEKNISDLSPFLKNKRLLVKFLNFIKDILEYANNIEISRRLLKIVETYAKIDRDIVVRIIGNIKKILNKYIGEDIDKRIVNKNLSSLIEIYLREDVVKKLAEYAKRDIKFAKKLSDTIRQLSIGSEIRLEDFISNIDIYYSADPDLAIYVLRLIDRNPNKIAYVLFNRSIIDGLIKMPRDYRQSIAKKLADFAEYRKINLKDYIESLANLMDKYSKDFPEIVEKIVLFHLWDSRLKEIINLALDKDLENILKNEYIRYPTNIKELVAEMITSTANYGYLDRFKLILNNSNFKRIIDAYKYINVGLVELNIKIAEIVRYNNWDDAIREFANVANLYREEDRLKLLFTLDGIKGESKTMEALYILKKYAPNLRAAIEEICKKSLFGREFDYFYRCKSNS